MDYKKQLNGIRMNPLQHFRKVNTLTNLLTVNSSKFERQKHIQFAQSKIDLSSLSFIVVSHVAFTGHAQELKNFLKQYAETLTFIGHPFSYAFQKKSIAEYYENCVLKVKLNAPQTSGPETFLYLKDFLTTFYFTLRLRKKFHVYIGVDPLNALTGLILKRMGFAQITIFYVIDYVPLRFKNMILNSVYRFIDKLCVYNADFTWNLTSAMADARQSIGINKNHSNQMTVPTGTHSEKFDASQICSDKNTAVFLSHLREGQGIELVLEALPAVVKLIPSVKLFVIGTGPLEKYFREEVRKRELSDNIVFLGYIEDHDEIDKIVAKCRVGIAPYVPDPHSFTWYADPGKPKVYLGCGVPVIITKVPEVAFEISKRGAGIAINYNSHELSEAIIKFLCDDNFYQACRENAINLASELDWNSVFTKAFSKVLESR